MPSTSRSSESSEEEEEYSLDGFIERLMSGRKYDNVEMRREEIVVLLESVRIILMSRPMLLEVKAPINVMGDIHGQFYDLLRVFEQIGRPSPSNQIMMLGDYVDRGKFSVEVMCLLFAFKAEYPDAVHLLRGNHESTSISRVYGFYEEVKTRFDVGLWRLFMEVFDCLPVCGLISKSILCMHGGISPRLKSFNDIRKLVRPQEVPPGGLMADLLWSDPDKKVKDGWIENPRGVSFTFGEKQVHDLCKKLGLDLIMRAHQVVFYGYELFAKGKLITIFTAPNFCGQFENMGAIAKIDAKLTIKLVILDSRKGAMQLSGSYKKKR